MATSSFFVLLFSALLFFVTAESIVDGATLESTSSSRRVSSGSFSAGADAASAAAAFGTLGLEIAKFVGSSNGDRTKFAKNVINHVNSLGLNVVVCHPPSLAKGHEKSYKLVLTYRSKPRPYMVYVARRHKKMQVTNTGDGGWINWGLKGRWWVRWGNTVRFHPSWNYRTMGKPYETRPASDLPPF